MRNTKQCLIRYTNALLYISWNWTVTNDILFTRHSGVINAVILRLCKQSTCSCYNIGFFFIFYYCIFHYHQSSLNISMHVLSACTRYLRWLWYTVWSLYWKFRNGQEPLEAIRAIYFFFFRILLFCWKKIC